MIKTIQSLKPTNHIHPAIGRLYNVLFTDSTKALIYEESFFDVPEYYESGNDKDLIGKKIDLERACIFDTANMF